MTAVCGSTRRPISVTTWPFTSTLPSAISSSAARREATPAWASTFCNRTPSAAGGSPADDVAREAGVEGEVDGRLAARGREGREGRVLRRGSDIVDRVHFGQQGCERRQLLQRGEPQPL